MGWFNHQPGECSGEKNKLTFQPQNFGGSMDVKVAGKGLLLPKNSMEKKNGVKLVFGQRTRIRKVVILF